MSALLCVVAAVGVYYLYTAISFGWRGLAPAPGIEGPVPLRPARVRDWMVQAGLGDVRLRELAATMAALFLLATAAVFTVFGALLPALVVGAFAASFPILSYRQRRAARRARAQESWPRLLEEIRILTASVGRSIPQALFEAGQRAPEDIRPAFEAAHREWLVSTDFARTLTVLKGALADPTADATCETLLVAHAIGGNDLDTRLEALIADRVQDTQGRKDARAKQAGARFARRFVLFVPFGMALAGMSVGNGRAAFASPDGQLLTSVAVVLVFVCWAWAGRILRLPEEQRVFFE